MNVTCPPGCSEKLYVFGRVPFLAEWTYVMRHGMFGPELKIGMSEWQPFLIAQQWLNTLHGEAGACR